MPHGVSKGTTLLKPETERNTERQENGGRREQEKEEEEEGEVVGGARRKRMNLGGRGRDRWREENLGERDLRASAREVDPANTPALPV